MGIKFANGAVSVLTSGVTATDVDFLIDPADDGKFPIIPTVGADFFLITLEDEEHNIEIVKIVQHVEGSNTLKASIVGNRGQDGTTPRVWDIGDIVEIRPTAAALRILTLVTAYVETLLDDPDADTFLTTLTFSAFIRSLLLTADDDLTARALLGVTIGDDVQAFDQTLASLAALGTVADRLAYTTGVDTWAETPLTLKARELLDDATIEAMHNTLEVKKRVLDHGTKAGNFTLDLSLAELHLVAFSAAATLTINSTLGNDKGTVVVKSNGNAIALAGIDNNPPTLTAALSRQDFVGLVKSFGKITATVALLNVPTS